MKLFEKWFEAALWNSRLTVLVAVVASLLTALAMLYVATVDAIQMVGHLAHYSDTALAVSERAHLRSTLVAHVVEIIDGYLLATVLFIFAMGLYELFISKIDQAYQEETATSVLVINSLDDLKNRLAKVVLMILIVKLFEHAIGMEFHTPLDLLTFGATIALVGVALYLSHAGEHGHK